MLCVVALCFLIGTWIILRVVHAVVGWLVSPEGESMGRDLSQHNKRAYS
jgi:ammonia channel protein AmtB